MNENSYLDQILAMDDVDDRDKLVTLIDLVAAGIETVHFYLSDAAIPTEYLQARFCKFLNNYLRVLVFLQIVMSPRDHLQD